MKYQRLWVGFLATMILFWACSESEEKPAETISLQCSAGENAEGNGCALACDEGWHKGPDERCFMDCPSLMTEQEDGSCALECAEGEELMAMSLYSNVDDLNSPKLETTHCHRTICPAGMVVEGDDCAIPCAEGWTKNEDGECLLDCPEGMAPTNDDVGCTFVTVGENKAAPEEKWDTSIEGPNPIFVDANADPTTGEGTEEAPFATITQAVAAMEDEATVYVAEGTYDEQVIVDSKKTFNLIGVCADKVTIAPSTSIEIYPEGDDGKPAGAVSTWKVNNVRIHGISVHASETDGIKIRHDQEIGDAEAAQVDNVVVNQANVSAIGVYGAFGEISIVDNTVSSGQFGIDIIGNFTDEVNNQGAMPVGEVTIRGNSVSGMRVQDDRFDATGIFAMALESALISNNEISGMESGIGVDIWIIEDLVVEGNIVSKISGYGAFHIVGTRQEIEPCDVAFRDNIISDISAGPCKYDTCPEVAFGIELDNGQYDIWTQRGTAPFHAVLERNSIRGIQGDGIALFPDDVAGNTLDISNSYFEASASGVFWGAGDMNVTGCRFSRVWNAIYSTVDPSYLLAGDMSLEGNLFEKRRQDPAGMPEKYQKGYVNGVVFLAAAEGRGKMYVSGNLFRNNRAFDMDKYLFVLNLSGDTVDVTGNVFSENDGSATFVQHGKVTIEDNIYFENAVAVSLNQEVGMQLESAHVSHNYFVSSLIGLEAQWNEPTGDYTIEENVFIYSSLNIGDIEAIGTTASKLSVTKNYFGVARLQTSSIDALEVSDNMFEESRLLTAGQPEDASSVIRGNLFERSHIDVFRSEGAIEIEDNEFNGPSLVINFGTGIGVYESPGLVKILHNILRGYSVSSIDSVGEIGDAVHVVGTPGFATSDVWLESNLIEDNGRYGVFLSASDATMKGNMYLNNGKSGADDIVLFHATGDALNGDEAAFAVTVETPPATNDPEKISETVR